ncbi:MAG: PAS domain S-box protein [Planctomycetota bacterium]
MQESDSPSARAWHTTVRQLALPAALVLAVVVAALLLRHSLTHSQETGLAALCEAQSNATRASVEQAIGQRIDALERMAERWEASQGLTEELWRADAVHYIADLPLQALEWLDSDGIVRWVEPIDGNEDAVGLSIRFEERRRDAHERALATGKTAATRALKLVQGGSGFTVLVPLRVGGREDGCLAAVFRHEALLGRVLANAAPGFEIDVLNGGERVFQRSAEGADGSVAGAVWRTDVAGVPWSGATLPGEAVRDEHRTALPELVLLVGLLLAVSLGSAAFLARRARQHASRLEEAHERLRASERGLRTVKYMSDHALDAVFIIDRDGLILDANDSACRGLEYARDELIGTPISEVNPHLPSEAWAHHWSEIKRRGHLVFESEHVAKSGRIIPVEVVRGYIRFEDVECCCAFVRDISERRAAEAELRLLGQAVQQSLDGIFVTDTEDRLVFANDAFLDLHGYTLDEAIGEPLSMLYDRRSYEQTVVPALAQVRGAGSFQGEVEHRTKVGATFPMLQTLTILRDLAGKWVGTVGIARDVTEERAEAERRRTLERQLRQAQKLEAIGTLAGGVAHDFSNILTAILGFTRHARAELSRGGDVSSLIDRIDRTVDQGTGVTRSLLTFARQSPLERETFDLSARVEETLDLLRRLLPASIEVGGTRTPGTWIRGDATQVQQVLLNLAINARDAMPGGGCLLVEVKREGDEALLTVEDSGAGIQPDAIERLFEPFYSTKERGKGTGLGLALVHGIVADHGGTIDVRSTPDVGSSFRVSLPLAAAPSESDQGEAADAPNDTGGGALLLVEDDPHVHDALLLGLRGHGYEVASARDGAEAIERFHEAPDSFRAVLLDLDLPRIDGLSCLREMRRTRPDLPALVLTGNVSMSEADLGEPLLRKPFLVDELIGQIARLAPPRKSVRSA